ncbi:MAG: EpsI family protein [Candidatus Omnitrophica bacterium 4484_70.2]|nr:MAG: EpsI family protein [Candidatus Omnitrophica bacterium 4484_70.2]
MKDKYFWVLVFIFLLSSLVVKKISNSKVNIETSLVFSDLPLKLNNWKGKDLRLDKEVYEILGTKDVVMRAYKNTTNNKIITLAIVYSTKNRASFHPPEMCYLGGGGQLLKKSKERIWLGKNYLDANKLVIKNSQGIIKAWYWYSAGGDFISNYYLQQIRLAWGALQGKNEGGALIRISTANASEEDVRLFIKELMPYLKKIF